MRDVRDLFPFLKSTLHEGPPALLSLKAMSESEKSPSPHQPQTSKEEAKETEAFNLSDLKDALPSELTAPGIASRADVSPEQGDQCGQESVQALILEDVKTPSGAAQATQPSPSSSSSGETEAAAANQTTPPSQRVSPSTREAPAAPKPGDLQVGLLYDGSMELHRGPGEEHPPHFRMHLNATLCVASV